MPSSAWFGQAYRAALWSFRPLHSCQKSSPSYQFNSLNFDSKKLFVRSVEDHLKINMKLYIHSPICPQWKSWNCWVHVTHLGIREAINFMVPGLMTNAINDYWSLLCHDDESLKKEFQCWKLDRMHLSLYDIRDDIEVPSDPRNIFWKWWLSITMSYNLSCISVVSSVCL